MHVLSYIICGGIKRCFCLTSVCLTSDVCLSRISGFKSRTERPRKTEIGTEVAHVTRDSLRHHFQGQKVTGQGRQAVLLTAALTREADAAVIVRTYWVWETTDTLCLLARRWGGHWEGEGRGISCRHTHSLFFIDYVCLCDIQLQNQSSRQSPKTRLRGKAVWFDISVGTDRRRALPVMLLRR